MKPSYVHPSLKGFEKLEPVNSRPLYERLYHEVLIGGQDYSPETAAEHQGGVELMGKVLQVCQEFWAARGEFSDPFGAYMQGSFQSNMHTGQFLTPGPLCQVMTRMCLDTESFDGAPKFFNDPCSGTGRFMLSIADHYATHNHGVFNFLVENTDIDLRAFVYCTMNAWLHGIPAITIWGDTLNMEAFDAFITFRHLGMPPQCVRLSKEVAQSLLEEPFCIADEDTGHSTVPKAGQAVLFDFIKGEA